MVVIMWPVGTRGWRSPAGARAQSRNSVTRACCSSRSSQSGRCTTPGRGSWRAREASTGSSTSVIWPVAGGAGARSSRSTGTPPSRLVAPYRRLPGGLLPISPWSERPSGVPLRQLPVGSREVARVAVGIALEVVLMLGLGLPERTGGGHLGDHRAGPDARGVDVGDGVLGDLLLLVVEVEDGRAVAQTDVVALPVLRGGR